MTFFYYISIEFEPQSSCLYFFFFIFVVLLKQLMTGALFFGFGAHRVMQFKDAIQCDSII
jgi:hypothetical protein